MRSYCIFFLNKLYFYSSRFLEKIGFCKNKNTIIFIYQIDKNVNEILKNLQRFYQKLLRKAFLINKMNFRKEANIGDIIRKMAKISKYFVISAANRSFTRSLLNKC